MSEDLPISGPKATETTIGLVYTLGAVLVWGLSPMLLKLMKSVPALEILGHRLLWSVVFVGVLVAMRGKVKATFAALRNRRMLGIYAVTTLLVSANWLIFIYAVNTDRLLQASLGYFLNPLVNVLLGVLFLRERLNRTQSFAVGLAMVGVANIVLMTGGLPWISLSLATTFGVYMLIRKKVGIDPLGGLLVETTLVVPAALAWIWWLDLQGAAVVFHEGWYMVGLLALLGAFSALPLIWIAHGARRLPLSTVGLLQYLAPTAQFLMAVLLYGEPLSVPHLTAFAFIWTALAVYSYDMFWSRKPLPAPAA